VRLPQTSQEPTLSFTISRILRRPPKLVWWRRTVCIVCLVLSGLFVMTACGKSTTTPTTAGTGTSQTSTGVGQPTTCPSSNTKAFAKTKFVLHAGLAFGTFHRYIYKPYRAGTFKSGAHGRITAFIKAGATALFIKREVRLATEDVKANPTLCKVIAAPLSNLADNISGAVSRLKGGDASGVESANTQISDITKSSSADGTPITERTDESAG
jgi:hypothetical protein